ncbi:MAG: GvpL/GvpF family gas vesicle protein [Hyphomicrobiales bacterium]|nr:GvpL/GvpF family gas vesicle protein [Hyphomicrobiales bacterium]
MSGYRLIGVTTPQAADKLIASGAALAGEPLFITRYPGLAALRVRADGASTRSPADFQRQVAAAAAAGPLLPAAADNPLIDETEALRALAIGHARLSQALDLFRSHRQYRITVLWNPLIAMAHCATQPEFKAALGKVDGDSAARSRVIGELIAAARDRLRAGAAKRLAAASVSLVETQPPSPSTVASMAVLVDQAKEAAFDAALEDVYASFPDLSVDQVGPLPPSAFASLVIERPSAHDIAEARLALGLDGSHDEALYTAYAAAIAPARFGAKDDPSRIAAITQAYRLLQRLDEATSAGGDRDEPILVDLVGAGGARWAA